MRLQKRRLRLLVLLVSKIIIDSGMFVLIHVKRFCLFHIKKTSMSIKKPSQRTKPNFQIAFEVLRSNEFA